MIRRGWLKGSLAVLAVCGLAAASCGDDDSADGIGDGSTPDGSASTADPVAADDPDGAVTDIWEPVLPEPATVWEEFLAEMDEVGRVPKEIALEAFALAYGPIPGVEVRAGDPGPIASMTARSWLSHHRDELTPEQTEAVHAALATVDAGGRPIDEWLDGNADGADDEASLGSGGTLIAFTQEGPDSGPKSCWNQEPVALANAPGTEPYRPLIDTELALLATKLGPLGIPVYLGFGSEGGTALADANPWNADCNQPASSCTIRLMPSAVSAFTADRDNLSSLLLHELTHCYHGALAPVNTMRNSMPWFFEGFATFAQHSLHPDVESIVTGWWALWFNNTMHPLNGRSYDAVGFFEHLVALGADPWVSFEDAIGSAQALDQFIAFTEGVRTNFEDTWASSVSRQPDRGPAWDDELPGMPEVTPTLATVTIDNDTRTLFRTLDLGVVLVDLEFVADVVIVDPIAGRGRLGWGSGEEVQFDPATADAVYCAASGGCECPTSEMTALPFGSALLALSSDPSPGEVVITGMSISELCGTEPAPSGDGRESLWTGNVCDLLSDADVAAVFGGRPPTSTEPADANTVAADGYGGSSCRWKVSVADHLLLDVFPSADVNIDQLAAYDPHDRWDPQPIGGIGDEARVLRWNGDSALPVAPGSVGAVVVLDGAVGVRLEVTAGYPSEPDGLIAAAGVVLSAAG